MCYSITTTEVLSTLHFATFLELSISLRSVLVFPANKPPLPYRSLNQKFVVLIIFIGRTHAIFFLLFVDGKVDSKNIYALATFPQLG